MRWTTANLFAEFFENVYVNHDEDTTIDSFILNRDDANCHNFNVTGITSNGHQ